MVRKCNHCGKSFEHSRFRLCCSQECVRARIVVGALKGRPPEHRSCVCEWCGRTFTRNNHDKNAARFCNKKCSGAKRTALSRARIEAQRENKRQERERDLLSKRSEISRRRMARMGLEVSCRVCGGRFVKPLGKGLRDLCSAYCRATAMKAARRRMRERHGTKPCERARARGLPYERCGPISVGTRDKWRCQICGVSTPRRLRGTYDPCAPEIDHIIPLAHPESPGHVWSNVQCLCRRCNARKGATIGGQFRLGIEGGPQKSLASCLPNQPSLELTKSDLSKHLIQ